MHEFSISSEVAQTVLDTAREKGGGKVISILLEIGEITLLNAEQVRFWVEELLKGTIAEGAEIRVKTTKVHIECESCNYQGRPVFDPKEGAGFLGPFYCPKCKTFRVEVKKGNECTLRQIRMFR